MRQTLDFLLYRWLKVDRLSARERFSEHSRETFDAVLDTCEKIAREKFAPFNRLADTEEPRFDGERVHLPRATHEAIAAYVGSGMLAAAQDYEHGGMQLPCVVEMAANCFFSKASVAMGGYAMLTNGNANLLMAHGTPAQREVFAMNEFSGRWFGTMCLSEPQAGSSLSDVATRAEPDGDGFQADPLGPRYRLTGNKMWISGGEHELTENIVHLVLAKIPGPDGKPLPGTKGISLFIVPKHLVDTDARLTGERNDVALAGLNHKLGYRGIPNTLLNFGEGKYPVRGGAGAVGAAARGPVRARRFRAFGPAAGRAVRGRGGADGCDQRGRDRRGLPRRRPVVARAPARAGVVALHDPVDPVLHSRGAVVDGAAAAARQGQSALPRLHRIVRCHHRVGVAGGDPARHRQLDTVRLPRTHRRGGARVCGDLVVVDCTFG